MNKDELKKEYFALLAKSKRREFFMHLAVYVMINSLLVLINIATLFTDSGPKSIWQFWAFWPLFGWGIGLFFHGVDTFYGHEDQIRLRELEIEMGISRQNK